MFAKFKISIVLSVALMCIFGLSTKAAGPNAPAVTIGNISTAAHSTITAITAQNGLVTATPGYVVTKYTISLVANNQNATVLVSPITVDGAALTTQIKDALNSHVNQQSKLLITGLKVMGGGSIMDGSNVTYTLDN